MAMTDLSWDDLRTLATLAAEKADESSLSMPERERWADLSDRVLAATGTSADLRSVAELADLDATLQRDAKVRQRYHALAQRAFAAAK